MTTEKRWIAAHTALWGVVLATACATSAWAQDQAAKPPNRDDGKQALPAVPAPRLTEMELIKKVYRTIVEVRVDHGLGGGVVVDAAKGLVATNFHVVSGATKGVVVFSSDKDRKEYAIDGFVAALPGRDLAILHVQAGDKKLTALELAQKLPEQGETVYVFGSSVGLSGTVARGMVAAIRSSQDLADLWDRKEGKGFFKRVLGYDMGCTWIQHDAPVSHGSSGGPLVSGQAEVLGLNTLFFDPRGDGPNLNFAISAKHLRAALATADAAVKPLSELPMSRVDASFDALGGDPERTLTAWKAFNRAMSAFEGQLAAAQRNLDAVHRAAAGAPVRANQDRTEQLAAAYTLFADAYSGLATKLGAINLRSVHHKLTVNHELTDWLLTEAIVLDRAGKSYRELASWTWANGTDAERYAEAKVSAYKDILKQLQRRHADLRGKLSKMFAIEFPTVEQTARENQRPAKAPRSATETVAIAKLFAKAGPAVVEIRTDAGTGQGVVVDAARGLVATNYHLIEGVKKARMTFPFDKDKKVYPVEGFVAVLPAQDLALLRIDLGERKLEASKLASAMPVQGEPAYALCAGHHAGPQDAVADGIVVAVRSAQELHGPLNRWLAEGSARPVWARDMNCTWVQHDVAIELGDIGGPLLNLRGEVLGLNAFVGHFSRDFAFAVSAPDLKQFLATAAGKPVQALEKLPPPRHPN